MPLALVLFAIAAAAVLGFVAGRRRRVDPARPAGEADAATVPSTPEPPIAAQATDGRGGEGRPPPVDPLIAERARLLRSLEAELAAARRRAASAEAIATHALALAEDRQALFRAVAAARAESARYRDLVIAIEDEAAPPLLGSPGAPDDLKLIVGIGPVLERMLHQLGITTFRQIALLTDRDIDAIDARLPEFPGRIRRDAWVVQARALHQSVHGEAPRR